MLTEQQKAERLEMIRQVGEKMKAKKRQTRERMSRVRQESKTLIKRTPKKEKTGFEVPKETHNVNQYTDASKYAKKYYGETMFETQRFDNDWN